MNNYAIETGKLYTDVYFVLEHQPDFCDSYPADGKVTFTNITIAWEDKVEQNPHWTVNQFVFYYSLKFSFCLLFFERKT